MTPFFFGNSHRQLFGAYDAPPAGGRLGAVLCYPFAREYLLAHGTCRYLARVLSGAGYHVLRFDYFGTGDSAGEPEAADAAQWLGDIDAAIDELRDMAGVERIALVGLRYGAVLAAKAARMRCDVDRLVLWEPLTDGAGYLAGLGLRGAVAPWEAQGTLLSAQLRRDIEGVSLDVFGAGLPRTLVLTSNDAADGGAALREHLSARGVAHDAQYVPDVAIWAREWGSGGVGMPVRAVRSIVAWMS
jgi:pimeloyl-ACP methyl ester carboxylesterase